MSDLQCTRCGARDFRKNGTHAGVQRYRCRACGGYFSDRPRKFGFADKAKALDMYLNNVGIRKIARFMGASPALMVRWVKAFGAQVSAQIAAAGASTATDAPDIIEMDEVYTFVQKNSSAPSYGVLIAGDRVALLRITSAKASTRPSRSTAK